MTQICVPVCVRTYESVLPVWVLLRDTTRGFSAPHSSSSVPPPALGEVSLKDSPG